MVDLNNQYDPDAEASNFDTVPAGTYEAEIVESERQPVSKQNDVGDCLSLCWRIVSGDFEGRLFWQRINLWWTGPEKSPGQVVNIANSQFRGVRDATGVPNPIDSSELHHIPCLVTYGPQKNDPNYSEVKSVKPAGQPVRQTAGQRPAPQQRPQATSNRGPQANTNRAPATAPRSAPSAGNRPWDRQRQPAPAGIDDDIPF